MRRFLLFVFALVLFISINSCGLVDNEVQVYFIVENQCNDTVVLKLYHTSVRPDSTVYYSNFDMLNPDSVVNESVVIDRTIGKLAIPVGAKVEYMDFYHAGGRGRKAGKIDVEANSFFSIERLFNDSVTVIFSDGLMVHHTQNGTSENNPLKRNSYIREGHTFTYTITEADHEAAKVAGAR